MFFCKASYNEKKTVPKYYIDISSNANENIKNEENHIDNDEMVLAEYASSHSLLDSILTTIDVDNFSNNVEFPEYGKLLVENVPRSEIDPINTVKIDTRTWGDNWKVDGIDKFEEQTFHDVDGRKKIKQTLTPEVVPLLVPQSSESSKVIIGGKDVDEVSILSEKMSIGSIEYSPSESEEDMVDIDVQNQTIEVFLREENNVESAYNDEPLAASKSSLSLLSAPSNQTVGEGTIISLSCSVQGIKPIGKYRQKESFKYDKNNEL